MATRKEINSILDVAAPELLQCIDPNQHLLAELVKNNVAQYLWCKDLEGKVHSSKVSEILSLVRAGGVTKFEGLVAALNATNQLGAVEILKIKQSQLPANQATSTETPTQAVMAAATTPTMLWHKDNIEGQTIVMYDLNYKALLNKKRSKLTNCLQLDRLWPHLKELEVVDKKTISRIQNGNTLNVQVDKFIDYLEVNKVWKLHGFLYACASESQDNVFEIIGTDINIYKEHL